MARLYFAETLIDPPISPGAAVTSTSETALWSVPQFTPIAANNPVPGRVYQVMACGLMSASLVTATIKLTVRFGTTVAGGVALASPATKTVGTSFAGNNWWMTFNMAFVSVGAPGLNSGAVCGGFFAMSYTTAASAQILMSLTGALATVDASLQQGISVGVALVSATMTTNLVYIQSLN